MVARAGNGWKLAAALIRLEDQVNAKFPARSKDSDGSIGDTSHAARKSDHNIRNGYCHAIDITHDPRNGFDSYAFADMLLAKQDPRMQYVISNRRIGSGPHGPEPGKWRPYTGVNPHDHHVHISTNALGETDSRDWDIGNAPVVAQPSAPAVKPTLRKNDHGPNVMNLKAILNIKGIRVSQVSDIFDNETFLGVRVFQLQHGLVDDGVVGPQTWKVLAI